MNLKKMIPLILGLTLLASTGFILLDPIINPNGTNRVEASTIVTTLYKATVIKDQAAIHTSNSGSAKVIGHLKKNTTVEVIQVKGTWMKIKNGTGYAWIWGKYVKKIVVTLYKATIIKDQAPIHTTINGKVIGHLKKNTTVEVVEVSGKCMKIKNGSGYAWIYGPYISKIVPTLYKAMVIKDQAPIHTTINGKVIGHLKKNTTVEIVEVSGSCMKIKNGSGYAWIYGPYISSIISGAPQPNKYYALPSGSHVYALDLTKANNVKMTNSFNRATKEKEFYNLAKAIGARYDRGTINFTKVSPESLIPEYDDAFVAVNVFEPNTKNETLVFSYASPRSLLETQAEYLMKHVLRPYFPKSYKQLAEDYIRKGYYQAIANYTAAKKVEGYYLDMSGGAIYISKNKPQY